jgi:hypothetical protein
VSRLCPGRCAATPCRRDQNWITEVCEGPPDGRRKPGRDDSSARAMFGENRPLPRGGWVKNTPPVATGARNLESRPGRSGTLVKRIVDYRIMPPCFAGLGPRGSSAWRERCLVFERPILAEDLRSPLSRRRFNSAKPLAKNRICS